MIKKNIKKDILLKGTEKNNYYEKYTIFIVNIIFIFL
jgi:hypothetical protein